MRPLWAQAQRSWVILLPILQEKIGIGHKLENYGFFQEKKPFKHLTLFYRSDPPLQRHPKKIHAREDAAYSIPGVYVSNSSRLKVVQK